MAYTPGDWTDGEHRWGKRKTDRWAWSWKPRVCRCCGSIHHDDAIRLVREGWEPERATGKGYKVYFNPPGYATFPSIVLPVPPVKLYSYHMSPLDIERYNAAL